MLLFRLKLWRKVFFLFMYLLFTYSLFAAAKTFELGGVIEPELQIRMHIEINGTQVDGYYFYDSQKVRIPLHGIVKPSSSETSTDLRIEEATGKTLSATIEGSITQDGDGKGYYRFDGRWIPSDKKKKVRGVQAQTIRQVGKTQLLWSGKIKCSKAKKLKICDNKIIKQYFRVDGLEHTVQDTINKILKKNSCCTPLFGTLSDKLLSVYWDSYPSPESSDEDNGGHLPFTEPAPDPFTTDLTSGQNISLRTLLDRKHFT